MSAVVVIVIILILVLLSFLKISDPVEKPKLHGCNHKFLEALLENCSSLTQPFEPTFLWGKNGHVQTIVHAIFGRVFSPKAKNSRRYSLLLSDGATVTYDLYSPFGAHPSGDVTLVICPGIANSSQSIYVQALLRLAQCDGWRCGALNHLGVPADVPLTSPRVFSYGSTEELAEMLNHLVTVHPQTKIILIGFSMGANIVVKYLGEQRNRPSQIIGAMSICQGYDAMLSLQTLRQLNGILPRLYQHGLAEAMRRVLLRHSSILFSEATRQKYSLPDTAYILNSPSLMEIDELYTRRIQGFDNLEEFYQSQSSVYNLPNVTTPLILLNARDDPLIPPSLLNVAKSAAESQESLVYIETKHGGHLGFFEGGLLYPNPVTWIDRLVAEVATTLVQLHHMSSLSFIKQK